MNNKRFITEVASQTGYTNKSTQDLADSLIKIMAAQLEEGNSILVPNFGTFEVKKKNERIMVSPMTQQRMLVPPKLVVSFKPSTSVKDKFK
ncbi:MAG: HU family DNA-binding protein [Bacteroidaceae bacterium]|jgi:DNA-binding protein HU-beta|nr:HU family DNA-binding protein [Bacteroidaceae bacterium]MBR6988830.1 HU family DNA-binding protein [Bacteroidaceae bacterium]